MAQSDEMDEWTWHRTNPDANKLPAPVAVNRDETISFENDLRAIINKHSKENGSNTPDFILADYLISCLHAFDLAAALAKNWQHFDCD